MPNGRFPKTAGVSRTLRDDEDVGEEEGKKDAAGEEDFACREKVNK